MMNWQRMKLMISNEQKTEIRVDWERLRTQTSMLLGMISGGHFEAASQSADGMIEQLEEFDGHVKQLTAPEEGAAKVSDGDKATNTKKKTSRKSPPAT